MNGKGGAEVKDFDLASLKVILPVSFYGGYFGAGVGILMLGVFSLATGRWSGEANMTVIGALAADAMAQAIVRAATQAESSSGVPWTRSTSSPTGSVLGKPSIQSS